MYNDIFVSNVFITPARPKHGSNTVAYASVELNNLIRIYGLRVAAKEDNTKIVIWPKYTEKKFKPILLYDKDFNNYVCEQIVQAYDKSNGGEHDLAKERNYS